MQNQIETFRCKSGRKMIHRGLAKIIRKRVGSSILRVSRRKNGLTSSGKTLRCHGNVERLVEIYGGRRQSGYEIQMNYGTNERKKLKTVRLSFHSVWITPEGRAVDVTKKSAAESYSVDESEILFFPTVFDRANAMNGDAPLDEIMWFADQPWLGYRSHLGTKFQLNPADAFKATMKQFDPRIQFVNNDWSHLSLFELPSMRSGQTDLQRLKEVRGNLV